MFKKTLFSIRSFQSLILDIVNWKLFHSVAAVLILTAVSSKAQTSLISEGAKLTLISDQFAFTEGPAADKKGNVYFTDQPNDKIWKYSTKGVLSLYMDGSGRANGLFFDKDGNLLACADNDNELWKIDKDKNVEVLVKNWNNKRLNGPNDLWIDAKGGIYYSDPFYKRDYWKHTESEQEEQRVYYRNQAGDVQIAAADFVRPNGLIGDRVNKKMYITDIGDKKTYVYHMAADGTLSNKKLFCKQGSDGMTLDELGNVYLVGKGVTIYSPEGEVLEKINVPENWSANITFGGKKNKTLFITASKSLYSIEMNVRGAK